MGGDTPLHVECFYGKALPEIAMKSFLDCAIELASLGFRVFPVKANSKKPPLYKQFWDVASSDPDVLRSLWKHDPIMDCAESYNPAISTTRYDDAALVVLDVDPKHGGDSSLESLRIIEGYKLPDTYEQHTPSGGTHCVYVLPEGLSCAGSIGEIAPGLDIRAHHGYILGAGAQTDAGIYTSTIRPIAPAPEWLVEWARRHTPQEKGKAEEPRVTDRRVALRRAHEYLLSREPAPEGERDDSAYRCAAYLREMGLGLEDAIEQMQLWFRYHGTFGSDEIEHAVRSAYQYASGDPGSRTAERYFQPVPDARVSEEPPLRIGPDEETKDAAPPSKDLRHQWNERYAFIMLGNKARIMWIDRDHRGLPRREFLEIPDFRAKHAGERFSDSEGKKSLGAVDEWLGWSGRSSFDGLVFAPGQTVPKRFYNTWQGFAYEPLARGEKPTAEMKEAVEMFKTQIHENMAAGVQEHARWITGFFAHLIQKPQEKPLVAPVFRGGKGNGKSTIANMVGALVEPHTFVASDQRYLVSNFNGHMDGKLLFIMEEAMWGGDKGAESVLKELVTSYKIPIEQKFREATRVDNYMRIVIIGNEDWQVPASLKDERRWAAFHVDMRSHPFTTVEDKRKVRAWFHRMRTLMEKGGYRYLLTYLRDFDLESIDVNEAPMTGALMDQIEYTLSPLLQWWLECLRDGRITEGDFLEGWPQDAEKSRIRDAFTRYCGRRNIDGRLPSAVVIGKELKRVCPSLQTDKKNSNNAWIYRVPPLVVARDEWSAVLGRAPAWPDDEDY